jgi:hypothetical protein
VSTTPNWDAHFGAALGHLKRAQILRPEPRPANEPPPSMEAEAAVRAQERYLHAYEEPVEPKSPDVLRN